MQTDIRVFFAQQQNGCGIIHVGTQRHSADKFGYAGFDNVSFKSLIQFFLIKGLFFFIDSVFPRIPFGRCPVQQQIIKISPNIVYCSQR